MLKETSYEVLIVSANEKFNTTLSRLIPLSINAYITYAENLNLAGRLLLERHFDIVLINNNKDFIEEIEFSIKLSRSNRGVILFTDSINYDEAYYKTNEFGVCVLSRPIESLLFIQSLRVLVSTLDKIKFMSNNKKTFKDKLEEIRIIDEAKLLLIKNEGLSEEEAHKKIEKAAMNQRTTRRKIAEAIIQDMKVDHEIK